jgi:hypothetical protein
MPESIGTKSLIIKAGERRFMLLIASNSYQDREDEIVKEKALKAYVDHFEPTPHLFWHGGDPIGEIIAAEMHGPFLLEVSRELPDARINLARGEEPDIWVSRKAVWDAIEKNTIPWGASIGFYYQKGDEQDGAFSAILKKETSTLPLEDAANGITLSNVIGGEPMSNAVKTKRRSVMEILGLKTDTAKAIDAALEDVRDKLDSEGVARKEFDHKRVKGLVEDLQARIVELLSEITDDEGKRDAISNTIISELMGTATEVVEELPMEEMADTEDDDASPIPLEEMRELTETVKALALDNAAREEEMNEVAKATIEALTILKELAPLTENAKEIVGVVERMAALEKQLGETPRSVASKPKFTIKDIEDAKKSLEDGGEPQKTVLGVRVKE